MNVSVFKGKILVGYLYFYSEIMIIEHIFIELMKCLHVLT